MDAGNSRDGIPQGFTETGCIAPASFYFYLILYMKIEIRAYDPLRPEDISDSGQPVILTLGENDKEVHIQTDSDLFSVNLEELFEAVSKFRQHADQHDLIEL